MTDEEKAKAEAAAKAQADAEAKAAADAKAKVDAKAKADEAANRAAHPEVFDPDYTGPLTCDQASARIAQLQLHGRTHIGDLKAYETKPAAAASQKKSA